MEILGGIKIILLIVYDLSLNWKTQFPRYPLFVDAYRLGTVYCCCSKDKTTSSSTSADKHNVRLGKSISKCFQPCLSWNENVQMLVPPHQ